MSSPRTSLPVVDASGLSARGGKQAVAAVAAPLTGLRVQGLYAHVPFCKHKCHYCDFYSLVDVEDRQEAFVERFEADVDASRRWLQAPLETIFVGGGTPTLLRPELLRRLCQAIATVPREAECEWTVEANPETVNAEVASILADSGVNRVSLGAQSFEPALLRTLERQHDPARVRGAVEALRGAGLDDINLDLIFGIPGSSVESWGRDLDAILAMEPTHVSCYALTYEPGTALEAKLRQGRIVRVDEELECDQLEEARVRLGCAGYEHYEISNWARSGRECRHNRLYWEMGSWWALGPSASAQVGRTRWRNVPRLGDWLSGPALGDAIDVETSSEDQWVGECFMMGLRLLQGMPRERVEALLRVGQSAGRRARALEESVGRGWLRWESDRLALTAEGLLVANEVIRPLLAEDQVNGTAP